MIEQIRQKYPQYKDLSDRELADALHGKFYSDMPKAEFYTRVGLEERDPEGIRGSYGSGLARTVGQGVTFGFGDEIEAGARSAFGDKTYEEEVARIRGGGR